ncbi:MAG: protease inhibitor I42 family protein [Dehalococcoidales bacterium]
MKAKLILVGAMVAILLSIYACSPAAIDVSYDDFMNLQHISQETEVAVDDSFTVTLGSNPASTGFQWSESAQISDQTILQQTAYELVPPTDGLLLAPGTPGKEIWTFQALKEGESTVSMEYSRSWEEGEEAAWTFNLTVTVK